MAFYGFADAVGVHSATSATSPGVTTVTNLVAVVLAQCSGGMTLTAADSRSNSWAMAAATNPFTVAGGGTKVLYAFISQLTGVGINHTFTVNDSGVDDIIMAPLFFSGRAASSVQDGATGTYADSGFLQVHTGPQLTGLTAGDDVVMIGASCGNANADTFTAGAGMTIATQFAGDGITQNPCVFQYAANVSGTVTAGWSTGRFVKGGGIMLALLQATTPVFQPVNTQTQFFTYDQYTQY